jgi:hypothetical protein
MLYISYMNTATIIYLEFIRKVIFALPGTREGICFGTEGFYFQKKLLARMKEDGETLAMPVADRNVLIKAQPDVFFTTPHYDNSNYVLIKLAIIEPGQLKQLLIDSWLMRANKAAIKEYEAQTK